MIFNLTQGQSNKTPVLDENYPADVTINDGVTTSATFKVAIAENGRPSEYTYQWYVDDVPVDGATGTSFVLSDLIKAATKNVYCLVTNKAGVVQSRTATLSVKHTLLYKNGTRFDAVTGGFSTAAKKRESGSDGTALAPLVTYKTDHILIDHNNTGHGIAYFKNKLDLTNLKTLHVKAQFYFNKGANTWQLGTRVWSSIGTYANDNVVASWGPAAGTHNDTQNIEVNVSSVSGSNYIGFWLQTANAGHTYYYIKVYDMWLEG